ncbi:MAG: four helix bundle suffix domain-containing protein [Chlorobiales bacterium]|nr:four helix bundle suffix domain-containing protein [Chlorobiales bacterium]
MSDLIPKHGGYRNLKSFQVARLVYDLTVRFVELYIDKFSRTKDQMVQAARSGVQNIAEGSLASATSKKTELKLTQVARASLEELRLDYEDFLRQRGLPEFKPNHPALERFKELKCQSLEEVQRWVKKERTLGTSTDGQGRTQTDREKRSDTDYFRPESVNVHARPCQSDLLSSACLAANAALSLINLVCYFLDRQVSRLAQDFENEGGFTERLYRVRSAKRRSQG